MSLSITPSLHQAGCRIRIPRLSLSGVSFSSPGQDWAALAFEWQVSLIQADNTEVIVHAESLNLAFFWSVE